MYPALYLSFCLPFCPFYPVQCTVPYSCTSLLCLSSSSNCILAFLLLFFVFIYLFSCCFASFLFACLGLTDIQASCVMYIMQIKSNPPQSPDFCCPVCSSPHMTPAICIHHFVVHCFIFDFLTSMCTPQPQLAMYPKLFQ